MRPPERACWVIIFALVAFAIASWFATRGQAAELPSSWLVRGLMREQASLSSQTETPVDAQELAEAIAAIPHITGEWAALVLTVAAHESALSARIARGDCKKFECDHGLAWGLWQGHRDRTNAAEWGSPRVSMQARAAARTLRGAYYTCNPKGVRRADWALLTFRAYAGNDCTTPLKGEEKRLATFNRLRARL